VRHPTVLTRDTLGSGSPLNQGLAHPTVLTCDTLGSGSLLNQGLTASSMLVLASSMVVLDRTQDRD
jgi:hypothetical protein